MDANFGLCRKKSAGNSVRSPLHSKSLFLDQLEVNEFVNNYGSLQTTNTQVIVIMVPCTYINQSSISETSNLQCISVQLIILVSIPVMQ